FLAYYTIADPTGNYVPAAIVFCGWIFWIGVFLMVYAWRVRIGERTKGTVAERLGKWLNDVERYVCPYCARLIDVNGRAKHDMKHKPLLALKQFPKPLSSAVVVRSVMGLPESSAPEWLTYEPAARSSFAGPAGRKSITG